MTNVIEIQTPAAAWRPPSSTGPLCLTCLGARVVITPGARGRVRAPLVSPCPSCAPVPAARARV